jgi:phytoene synthase
MNQAVANTLPETSLHVRQRMDLQDCEDLMRTGSKSFFAASMVLPGRVRAPATALYAFCRLADDTIDLDAHLFGGPMGALQHLQQRLQRIYEGRPSQVPADRALAGVVARFAIPKSLLDALLEGFEWDLQSRRYDSIEDLHAYGARVAGTVGSMMAIIMGTRHPQAQARACELGVAMQLTNIARDVGEDALAGRLYLPRDWMREAGIDPDAWLRQPSFSPAIASVVARLLAAADELYERAALGIAALPRDCRPAIQAARLVYSEIGREIERARGDSISRRACVSTQRKLALMAVALGAAAVSPVRHQPGRDREPAPLDAIRFLVDAASIDETDAVRVPVIDDADDIGRSKRFDERATWALGLFERIEERNRASNSFVGAGVQAPSAFTAWRR